MGDTVPPAFTATPKADVLLTNFSTDEDFENEDVGRSDLDLFQVEAHGPEGSEFYLDNIKIERIDVE